MAPCLFIRNKRVENKLLTWKSTKHQNTGGSKTVLDPPTVEENPQNQVAFGLCVWRGGWSMCVCVCAKVNSVLCTVGPVPKWQKYPVIVAQLLARSVLVEAESPAASSSASNYLKDKTWGGWWRTMIGDKENKPERGCQLGQDRGAHQRGETARGDLKTGRCD